MSRKQAHQHSWVMASGHPFGAVTTYKCTSCSATRQEKRLSTADRMADMERRLFGGSGTNDK